MVPVVRVASAADAASCAAIYAPYVTDSAITFEEEAPGPDEMARRIVGAGRSHAWLVAEDEGQVRGYAYATTFRERAAFRWSCETGIYLDDTARGTGLGRRLYPALLERLAGRGFRIAVASITQPNEASMALHRGLGFEQVGMLAAIGWKHGAWHDVAWLQRPLGEGTVPGVIPAEPH